MTSATPPPVRMTFHALPHPSGQVHELGFHLDHPYLERCWAPILGPTAVLLLRRMPTLWEQSRTIGVWADELAASLGVGRGSGRNSPLIRAVGRLIHMRFASAAAEHEIDVYTEVRPLTARQLARVPFEVHRLHERLLAANPITQLCAAQRGVGSTPPGDWRSHA